MTSAKKQYAAPKLTVHGDVADITLASTSGSSLDGTYPQHTPIFGHTS